MNRLASAWTSPVFRWAARALSVAYLAFFLFMLAGHLLPGAEAPFGPLTARERLSFALIGVYFGGYLAAWKWEAVGGAIALAATIAFAIAANAQIHLPLIMAVPGVFYVAAAATSRGRTGAEDARGRSGG